jgi:hypothetical protein
MGARGRATVVRENDYPILAARFLDAVEVIARRERRPA